MNAHLSFDAIELWYVAGWTMIHFLWLGAIVGVASLASRVLLRRAAPSVRYVAALGCLMFLAALPIGIAAWLIGSSSPLQDALTRGIPNAVEQVAAADGTEGAIIELNEPSSATPAQAKLAAESEPSPGPSLQGRGISFATLETCVPYLPWVWIAGTPVTFALLAAGIVGTKHLRRASRAIDDAKFAAILAGLAKSLRVSKRVSIAVCDRIAAPVLVGILRPIILLPPAAITGWSPDEIEMVLLHELAHVRRWDNLVNLLQRVIESLLFFHPAVWLVSTWVRRERETCCDAIVVGRTNRPHAYAEMLVALAAQMPRSVLFHPAASSAMAAGPLRSRIRRILGLDDDPMLVSGKSFAILLASALLVATVTVFYLPTIGQAEEESATVKPENVENIEDRTDPQLKEGVRSEKELGVGAAEQVDAHQPQPVHQPETFDDKWPEGIVFPSPKEGEISRRTYEALGIKIVPAKIEAGTIGAYECEVVGSANVPPGVTGPVLLTDIADENTRNFDELAAALQKINPNEWTPVGCIATREGQTLQFKFVAGSSDLRRGIQTPIESTTQYREWLMSLGEGPRKERVIAERAWKRLGLMLAPLTDMEMLEAPGQEAPYQLKIVGGNLPKGMPKVSVLTKVGEFNITSFDELLNSLDSANLQGEGKVRCYAFANGKEYLFEAGPPGSEPQPVQRLEADPGKGRDWFGNPDVPESTRDWYGYRIAKKDDSSDEWPKGVAFPSPKEGEISKRAFELLGLKVVPPTDDELTGARRKGYSLGLKILNLPAGQLPGSRPVILVSLSRSPIGDFADLDRIITKIAQSRMHSGLANVELGGVAGDREFKSVVHLRPLEEVKIENDNRPVPTSDAIPQSSKIESAAAWPDAKVKPNDWMRSDSASPRFPSLEDQKLADLAFRKLGWELEPIDKEDLARVTALGYEGGVTIGQRTPSGPFGNNFSYGEIQTDDILVGLHVWPTRNLKDVAQVLGRDDLAELNPLKFYVVRQTTILSPTEPPKYRDIVQTGRVSVSLEERQSSRGSTTIPSQPGAASPAAEPGTYSAPAKRSAAGSAAEVPPYGLPAPEAEAASPPPQKGATPVEATTAAPNPGFDIVTTERIAPDGRTVYEQRAVPPTAKSALRYDGRNFDEWKREWQSNGQLESLDALEAFAAAGYGKEAASAILYGIYRESVVAQHVRKFLSGLSAEEAPAMVVNLRNVLENDLSVKRRVAAIRAIAAIGPEAESTLDILKEKLASDDPQERISAATAIKKIVGKDQYQKPIADVLGKELGITVVQTGDGVWAALPRDDAPDDGEAFNKFTEAVIKEQELLFPPDAKDRSSDLFGAP